MEVISVKKALKVVRWCNLYHIVVTVSPWNPLKNGNFRNLFWTLILFQRDHTTLKVWNLLLTLSYRWLQREVVFKKLVADNRLYGWASINVSANKHHLILVWVIEPISIENISLSAKCSWFGAGLSFLLPYKYTQRWDAPNALKYVW